MIYLIGKIVVSLLAALGIGFGMAWMLQMQLAARLREQLNSVIFETKSRIPQLESEITNRDQAIDGLREQLATAAKLETKINPAGSKEQEKQIDDLRQKVIDLESELQRIKDVGTDEMVFEIPEEDRIDDEEGEELQEDEEFLTDISDIFDEGDLEEDSSTGEQTAAVKDDADKQKNIEDELQSELAGWDDSDDAAPSGADTDVSLSADLQEKLAGLESARNLGDAATPNIDDDSDTLREKIGLLADSRKQLTDVVDAQTRELTKLEQKRNLQDKSLNVLNQQLELARMANERILQEMRELKSGNAAYDGASQSAAGG